jgi:transcriptional regulator with XRE-family HTH domain
MPKKSRKGGVELRAIRKARLKLPMSSQRLANRSGITLPHLARIERDEIKIPDAQTIGAVAEVLEIEVEELFALEERLNAPEVPSLRRDDPRVLAWLSKRAAWGLLSEQEFASRVLAQTTTDVEPEIERVEDLAVEIIREAMRVLRDLHREFTTAKAKLFPDDLKACLVYGDVKRDLITHYRLMLNALVNYISHITDGDEPEEAMQKALTEAVA